MQSIASKWKEHRTCNRDFFTPSQDNASKSNKEKAKILLYHLLQINPDDRFTAKDAVEFLEKECTDTFADRYGKLEFPGGYETKKGYAIDVGRFGRLESRNAGDNDKTGDVYLNVQTVTLNISKFLRNGGHITTERPSRWASWNNEHRSIYFWNKEWKRYEAKTAGEGDRFAQGKIASDTTENRDAFVKEFNEVWNTEKLWSTVDGRNNSEDGPIETRKPPKKEKGKQQRRLMSNQCPLVRLANEVNVHQQHSNCRDTAQTD